MQSWCDKLASTPTVGLKLSPYVVGGDAYVSAWEPLLSRLVGEQELRFNLEDPGPLNWGFVTEDGFKYGVNQQLVHVGFQHRMKAEPKSGGPPVMKMLSKPRLYTELLGEVTERLIEATLLLPNIVKRSVERVGVITTTQVDEEDLPPGLSKFVSYLGKPWKVPLENFSVSMTSEIGTEQKFSDRCIHLLIRPEDKTKLFMLQFDWQRTYSSPRPTNKDTLRTICEEAKKGAIAYFERLAVGNIFDEEIVGQ